jgi:hypothetical protein
MESDTDFFETACSCEKTARSTEKLVKIIIEYNRKVGPFSVLSKHEEEPLGVTHMIALIRAGQIAVWH